VQLLAGKSRTQEELLALWDELEWAAQIVLVADRAAHEMEGIDPELSARFVRGLAVDLPSAADDEDSRVAIVRAAAVARAIDLAHGAAEEIVRVAAPSAPALVEALERVGAAQRASGTRLTRGEVGIAAQPEPSEAPSADEFSTFLSDIAATVEEIVETAPWRKKLAEAILRWEGEGVRTRRLEAALDADTAPDVDGLLTAFFADVRRIREIRSELDVLRSDSVRSPVLADPDRTAEAEALLVSARAAAERRAEEAAKSIPQVDRWYFAPEKVAMDWLALDDRLIEELS
jgi:hypothetical protein